MRNFGLTGPNVEPKRNAASFTAEELLRGVVFSDGPVAEHVPEIAKNGMLADRITDAARLRAARGFIDSIAKNASLHTPEAMQKFTQLITSGDPNQVEYGRSLAGQIVLESMYTLPKIAEARAMLAEHPEKRDSVRQTVVAEIHKRAMTQGDGTSVGEQEENMYLLAALFFDLRERPDTVPAKASDASNSVSNRQCVAVVLGIEYFVEITSIVQILEFVHLGVAWMSGVAYEAFIGYETMIMVESAFAITEDLAITSDVAITSDSWFWHTKHFFNNEPTTELRAATSATPSVHRKPRAARWDMLIASIAESLHR